MYDIESIVCADSVAAAVQALAADEQAIVIAGGTDVLIKVREGRLAGCRLVSIHDIADLRGVTLEPNGNINIGALTTFADLEHDALLASLCPVLGEAAGQAGGPQLRVQGTVGGNICNGATSADTAPSLFALNAILQLTSSSGNRQIPIREFYLGPGKVALQSTEILTKIILRRDEYAGYLGHYIKYAMRNAMDIATMSCAVLVKPDDMDNKLADIRIALGVAAPTPIRAVKAEEALRGMSFESAVAKIGDLVRAEINPRSSWRASKEFRLHIAGEIAARALRQAWQRRGGESK